MSQPDAYLGLIWAVDGVVDVVNRTAGDESPHETENAAGPPAIGIP